MVRYDEPRANAAGQESGLTGRHVSRNSAGRIAAVDRQKQHVEWTGTERLGQPRINQGVAAVVEPESFGLDDIPQIKMTPCRSVSRPSWAEATARTRNPACSNVCPASSPAMRSSGRPRLARCSRIASGTTSQALDVRAKPPRSQGRSGPNACGWRARRRAGAAHTPYRGPRHSDMRPVRGIVLFGQMFGKIEIDGQHALPRLDQEAALAEPPQGQRSGSGTFA